MASLALVAMVLGSGILALAFGSAPRPSPDALAQPQWSFTMEGLVGLTGVCAFVLVLVRTTQMPQAEGRKRTAQRPAVTVVVATSDTTEAGPGLAPRSRCHSGPPAPGPDSSSRRHLQTEAAAISAQLTTPRQSEQQSSEANDASGDPSLQAGGVAVPGFAAADATLPPCCSYVVMPPYEPSNVQRRTYFAKMPGHHPSELTPGYEQRLALLLEGERHQEGEGGRRNAGTYRRLASVAVRAGCIELVMEEEEWGSGVEGDALSTRGSSCLDDDMQEQRAAAAVEGQAAGGGRHSSSSDGLMAQDGTGDGSGSSSLTVHGQRRGIGGGGGGIADSDGDGGGGGGRRFLDMQAIMDALQLPATPSDDSASSDAATTDVSAVTAPDAAAEAARVGAVGHVAPAGEDVCVTTLGSSVNPVAPVAATPPHRSPRQLAPASPATRHVQNAEWQVRIQVPSLHPRVLLLPQPQHHHHLLHGTPQAHQLAIAQPQGPTGAAPVPAAATIANLRAQLTCVASPAAASEVGAAAPASPSSAVLLTQGSPNPPRQPLLEVLLRCRSDYLPLRARWRRAVDSSDGVVGDGRRGGAASVPAGTGAREEEWDEGLQPPFGPWVRQTGLRVEPPEVLDDDADVVAGSLDVLRQQVLELDLELEVELAAVNGLLPGLALLDVRWRGLPVVAPPLVMTTDPAVAAELSAAVAAWARPPSELEEFLMDMGTWECHAAAAAARAEAQAGPQAGPLTARMMAATAVATGARVQAGPGGGIPAGGIPLASLLPLGAHLLRYARACRWQWTVQHVGRSMARLAAAARLQAGGLEAAAAAPAMMHSLLGAAAATAGVEEAVTVAGATAAGKSPCATACSASLRYEASRVPACGDMFRAPGAAAGSQHGRRGSAPSRQPALWRQALLEQWGLRRGRSGEEAAFQAWADPWVVAQAHALHFIDLLSLLTLLFRARHASMLHPANLTTMLACAPGAMLLVVQPLLARRTWAGLVKAYRLPRFFCYIATKALVAFCGFPPPPGIRAFARGPAQLMMEGVILPSCSLLPPAVTAAAMSALAIVHSSMLLTVERGIADASATTAFFIGVRTALVGTLAALLCQISLRVCFWQRRSAGTGLLTHDRKAFGKHE